MVEEKQTIGAIARRFNVPIGAIYNWLQKAGIETPRGKRGAQILRQGVKIVKSETVQSHRGGPTTADLKNQPLSLHL